ncbi:alkaline phosphatase [Photobacterium aphoticum]|uniref:Alkaline phosphatase n=1 Tax=Photobacterium aphoticum TaxID=754436 RepID=A0A0J1GFZ1_9GAMM|nr:alkaline phosphatase [Photobacterium aphoticum]KLU98614.1 hypothetical protein ABT58_21795 [Photobacterium aphoticum]PSU57534.1 alkaline phosphatase [Photobacterium aphoticum]
MNSTSTLVFTSVLAMSSASAGVLPDNQTQSVWFQDGQAKIAEITQKPVAYDEAKNVILFIGDGMGISTQTAARIFVGQSQINHQGGEEFLLSFEQFPYTALAKTYNTDMQVPDSAGTMTAMVTGVKTRAGMLSVSDYIDRGDCGVEAATLKTSLEYASERGMNTGIVSTARITHATPAATYAHISDRGWESGVPEDCNGKVKDIALQLVESDSAIDIVFGGGRRSFEPSGEGLSGRRTDARNLIQEWIDTAPAQRQFVDTASAMKDLPVGSEQQVLGLFSDSHMEYELHREGTTQPSLTEMTDTALNHLLADNDGFYLMVESGRIDHGHHAGIAKLALTETEQFHQTISHTVQKLADANQLDDTLIIVTADHSHVMTMAGYQQRGNPILGLAAGASGNVLAKDDKPYTTLGYANGPGALTTFNEGERVDLTDVNTQADDFQQQALVPLSSETHAGEDVAIYAMGPGAQWFNGLVEQNYIYHVINRTLSLQGRRYE